MRKENKMNVENPNRIIIVMGEIDLIKTDSKYHRKMNRQRGSLSLNLLQRIERKIQANGFEKQNN